MCFQRCELFVSSSQCQGCVYTALLQFSLQPRTIHVYALTAAATILRANLEPRATEEKSSVTAFVLRRPFTYRLDAKRVLWGTNASQTRSTLLPKLTHAFRANGVQNTLTFTYYTKLIGKQVVLSTQVSLPKTEEVGVLGS